VAAAARNSGISFTWEGVRATLYDLEELTRRLPHLKRHLFDLDLGTDVIAKSLGTLARNLDRQRRSIIHKSAEEFIGSAEAILEFARAAPEPHTLRQNEQVTDSWKRLWLNLRRDLHALSDDIDDILGTLQ
jgi:hypothetical protein